MGHNNTILNLCDWYIDLDSAKHTSASLSHCTMQ
jgi:hypothetical protein